MKARRHARITVLQALYEIDMTDHPPGPVFQQRVEENDLPRGALVFARRLLFGVLRYRDKIDPFIQEYASEWPLDQMACIDRNILRMAIYEFAVDGRTPVRVAIDEAVELAKEFGSDSSPRFVNGVLGSLVRLKDVIARKARERA